MSVIKNFRELTLSLLKFLLWWSISRKYLGQSISKEKFSPWKFTNKLSKFRSLWRSLFPGKTKIRNSHWISRTNFDDFWDTFQTYIILFIHPVQVPRWDAPRWLSLSTNLLKLLPRSQIIAPWPINELVPYPDHKETLSSVIFGKIDSPHWNRVFLVWS